MSARTTRGLEKSVVLVGMMGAGKSWVGRRLAVRLGVTFTDADAEIEAAAGCSIEDIFELHGESAFREGERRVIARILDGPPIVLATGGGAFMESETRDKIRQCATSIWLRTDIEALLKRVARRNNRPLLKNGDPREILERLLAERTPAYELADITVDSDTSGRDTTVETVLAALARHGEIDTPPKRDGKNTARA
ncbi:MAG: shikimate kinase [Alphaproteobacteria bacterium]